MAFALGVVAVCFARAHGADPAAPVILEELVAFGPVLAGQLAIWSADGVLRAMAAEAAPLRPSRRMAA